MIHKNDKEQENRQNIGRSGQVATSGQLIIAKILCYRYKSRQQSSCQLQLSFAERVTETSVETSKVEHDAEGILVVSADGAMHVGGIGHHRQNRRHGLPPEAEKALRAAVLC